MKFCRNQLLLALAGCLRASFRLASACASCARTASISVGRAPLLQVGELRLGAARRGPRPRGARAASFSCSSAKSGVARRDLLAALDRSSCASCAREGRGDADVFALGVALQRVALRAAARGGEESCEQDARARHRSASTNRFSA